jgi:uncharacterized protein (UPF0332 family)
VPKAVPIDPAKLVEAAREFANHQGGQGRPRPIWLRRSISSAYYGLFHCVGRQAAKHLLPGAAVEDHYRLARSFEHRALKEMCEWIAGRRGNPPQHATPVVKALAGTDIADVAAVFCDLQEARHRADYDHLAAFSKTAALGYVQDAEQAIAKLDAAPEAQRQAFFSLVALRTGIR